MPWRSACSSSTPVTEVCDDADVAVTEALGESLSPSQVSTYITGSAKWCFGYLIGLISVFAAEKNYSGKTSPLRQQLLTLHAQRPRPRLSSLDRLFWIVLGRVWPGWRRSLILVTPESVVRWHRAGGNRLDESLTRPKRGAFGFCRARALASRGFLL